MRLFAMLCALTVAAPAEAVTWDQGTLAQAMVKAKSGRRWILVDLYATWCGPCHDMDEKVYGRPEVERALGSFVALRRDGEQGEGKALVERYHTVGYPTLLVLDENAVEIDRLMGFVDAKELVATLENFRRGVGTLHALEERLRATPSDETLRAEVATRHAMRGDAAAVTELRRVVNADPDNKAKRASTALLVLGKYYHLRGRKEPQQAKDVLDELRRRYPTSVEAEEAPYQIATALLGLGKPAEARVELDRWLTASPKDSERFNAYAWFCFKNQVLLQHGIEVARRGLELDPKAHALWDTLAELCAANGQRADAEVAAKKALALRPGDPYYLTQLKRLSAPATEKSP